jgi:hypothetical protein
MDGFELNFDDLGEEGFCINLQEIAMSDWVAPTIRLLAMDLQKKTYMSLGEFFSKLSDNSVAELQVLAERGFDDADNIKNLDMQQVMILSLLLAGAEGTQNFDIRIIQKQMSMLLSLITFESLARKGLVRVYHENFTLGDDMADKLVVEKI